MKRITYILVMAVFALAIIGASVAAAEDESAWYEGSLKAGTTWTAQGRLHADESGSKGGLEYNALVGKRWTGVFGGDVNAEKDGWAINFDGLYRDVNDQDYEGMLSLKRVVVYKADYNRLYHRLGHDSLSNLEAHVFSGSGSAAGQSPRSGTDPVTGITYDTGGANTIGTASVYHTDLDPTNQYAISRQLFNHSVEFHIPQIPELGISFHHRYEQRAGDKQAMTNSKCRACHIVSDTQQIKEINNDYGPDVNLRIGTMALSYSYRHREFNVDNEGMEMLYNRTRNGTVEDFQNRVQYNDRTGELPYSRVPENRRDKHNAKFRWDVSEHTTLNAYYLYSSNENISTRGEYDALTGNYDDTLRLKDNTFGGKITTHVTHGLTINLFGKYQALDNSDVFVEKEELENQGGADDGLTLAEAYVAHGADPAEVEEYLELESERVSGYDSNNFKIGLSAAWRVLRNLKLNGEYEFTKENRDHYAHHHVPESTKEHLFKFGADYHFSHSLKFALDTKFAFIDDAYRLNNATCTPDGSYGEYGSKGDLDDYYDIERAYGPAIYDKRTADRSNRPDQIYEVKFKTYWNAMSMLNANFHVKYRYSKNGEIDGRDWNNNFLMTGLNIMANPIRNLTIAGGYTYMYDSYDSQYCIAIYDG